MGAAVSVEAVAAPAAAPDGVVLLAPLFDVCNRRSPLFPARTWYRLLDGVLIFTDRVRMAFPPDLLDKSALSLMREDKFVPRVVIRELFRLVARNRARAATFRIPVADDPGPARSGRGQRRGRTVLPRSPPGRSDSAMWRTPGTCCRSTEAGNGSWTRRRDFSARKPSGRAGRGLRTLVPRLCLGTHCRAGCCLPTGPNARQSRSSPSNQTRGRASPAVRSQAEPGTRAKSRPVGRPAG